MNIFDLDISFPGDTRMTAEIDGVSIHTGGEDEPSPFDLFLVSIGTCAGIKVLRFCQERHISTTGLTMKQRMFYSSNRNMIEKIELIIDLPPGFPMKYYDAVVRVAHTCGVKRHLIEPPDIVVSTVVHEGRS
jgi:putative redox protein